MICLENEITVTCGRAKLRIGTRMFVLPSPGGKRPLKHINKIQRENIKIEAMASVNLIQGHSLSCLQGPGR